MLGWFAAWLNGTGKLAGRSGPLAAALTCTSASSCTVNVALTHEVMIILCVTARVRDARLRSIGAPC
jgi:hypothetical protein